MNEQTYLYNEAEVRLTGRVAIRELERKQNRTNKDDTKKVKLVEIAPVDSGGFSRTFWVKFEELYKITEEKNE